jgi:hypothetical protein
MRKAQGYAGALGGGLNYSLSPCERQPFVTKAPLYDGARCLHVVGRRVPEERQSARG